jgi:hypothetical protein
MAQAFTFRAFGAGTKEFPLSPYTALYAGCVAPRLGVKIN